VCVCECVRACVLELVADLVCVTGEEGGVEGKLVEHGHARAFQHGALFVTEAVPVVRRRQLNRDVYL